MTEGGKYRTIVADPPWHYDAMPIGGGMPGSFGATRALAYQTMTYEDILALPVREMAADDAVLWLWTTNRWLPRTFAVMEAWGFDYRQTLVWGKNNPMPVGSVAPSAAEFLLAGRRGKPKVERAFPSSVIVTPRPPLRVHSAKPECFLDYIERTSPAPRLEMFARRARFGWDYWGNESLAPVTHPKEVQSVGRGRPRLLDLFSGAGGCTAGYQRAGFYVVGVDLHNQPNYCGEDFVQMDALEALRVLLDGGTIAGYRLEDFAAVHASPPCQGYSVANNIHGRDDHPLLIADVRELLRATGLPYVIENVEGARADMDSPYTLCGLSFGLGVKRHRCFETNVPMMVPPCPPGHPGDWVSVFGHTVLERGHVVGKAKGGGNTIKRRHLGVERGRDAMGIDWMTRDELSEAVPPAYCEHIGTYLLSHIQQEANAA